MARKFNVGDVALTRDDHPVRIVNIVREDGVDFAWIKYLDGHLPYDVAGRVTGTEDDPIWEHRVKRGDVLRPGGSYYNPADWTTEDGLRPVRWVGFRDGRVVAGYPSRAAADLALDRREVESVSDSPAVLTRSAS